MAKEFIALDDSKDALPLYVQLKEFLRNQIENNEYQCWDIIPSEMELQQIFNVSRTTVRQAITDLTNEGYLIKKQGKGTMVINNPNKIDETLNKIKSFTHEMLEKGLQPSTAFAQIEITKASNRVANALKIGEQEEVYRIYRIRCVNHEPIVVFITYLKQELQLPLDNNAYYGSLYELLTQNNKIRISKIKEWIEATPVNAQNRPRT